MTDTPTNTILLRGLPQNIEEADVGFIKKLYIVISRLNLFLLINIEQNAIKTLLSLA